MKRTDTVIIGGGQAGLAMSRCLTDRAIDHVVLERGRIGERWRSERWDSLRLLTPNWQSRLPGFRYRGPDPDGYMTMPEVVDYLWRFARSFRAPVEEGTTVVRVRATDAGYDVKTDRGDWMARNVVIATGHADRPYVPEMSKALSEDIFQIVPTRYRNPEQLPEGGVLIVGASASGLQLADEIHRSGRPVVLSVGRHNRLPRRYRGMDILWWLDLMGVFDEELDEARASLNKPSLQLVGRPDHSSLDLAILQDRGVRLVGKTLGIDGHRVAFADDLAASTSKADEKLSHLLARIDGFVKELAATPVEVRDDEPVNPFPPVRPRPAPSQIDLRDAGIETVLWATGFRRDYSWLDAPVLNEHGELRQRGGITAVPGLYVLGLQNQRRRKSSFIDGVGEDARELSERIACRFRHAA